MDVAVNFEIRSKTLRKFTSERVKESDSANAVSIATCQFNSTHGTVHGDRGKDKM